MPRRRFAVALALVLAASGGGPLAADTFEEAASRAAHARFEELAAAGEGGALPRLADPAASPMLLAIWDGVAIAPGRRFGGAAAPALHRFCTAGNAATERYITFGMSEPSAAAAFRNFELYQPEILEGMDFSIRCAAALLQSYAALVGETPDEDMTPARRADWDEARKALRDQLAGGLGMIAEGLVIREGADRFAVAYRESAERIAGALPRAEREELAGRALAAAARAEPLARADLEALAERLSAR